MKTSAKKITFLSMAFLLLLSCNSLSSGGNEENEVSSSSSEQKQTYKYCVFITIGICLTGPFSECEAGGLPSNECPYNSSSSRSSSSSFAIAPSSSSKPSSSSLDDTDDIELKKNSFELSLAGKSYGDIDAAKTYGQSELSGRNKIDIDIVAYYKSGAGNKIFNPCYVSTIGDDCGNPELYPIPQKYQSAIKSATKTSEIAEFLEDFADGKITGYSGTGINGGDENEVLEIDISKDKAFLVFSTDSKYFIVIMTATGTESVSLDFSSF
ncbi:MAG: hypothetical protein LBC75_10515 [Fibromonadaceae bacterium]|jgi:hypothetical protein|nr:hypothetical protein [Fibromonadaceae bacterium]